MLILREPLFQFLKRELKLNEEITLQADFRLRLLFDAV